MNHHLLNICTADIHLLYFKRIKLFDSYKLFSSRFFWILDYNTYSISLFWFLKRKVCFNLSFHWIRALRTPSVYNVKSTLIVGSPAYLKKTRAENCLHIYFSVTTVLLQRGSHTELTVMVKTALSVSLRNSLFPSCYSLPVSQMPSEFPALC